MAALLGVALAVLPALAASTTAKLEVNENCNGFTKWPCWTQPGGSPTYAHSITIASGGELMFADKTTVTTDVVWTAGSPPPVCTGVPNTPMGGWEGSCKFEQPGTYKFESANLFKDAYNDYTKYEVVVEGSTTTTGTTGTTPTTPTSTTTMPSPAPESPLAGSETHAVKIARSQRGGSVKGSIDLSQAAAGDRLEVDLLAQSASLARAKHSTRVRVGRYTRSPLLAGKLFFSVKLNAKARRAIKRHHRLALTVEVVLTPASGQGLTIARSVVQHA